MASFQRRPSCDCSAKSARCSAPTTPTAISEALFAAETERISRERAPAQKLVETLEIPYQAALENLDTALELLDNMQAAYLMVSDQERRLFNQAIFKRLNIDSEDVTDSEHAEPFDDLLDGDFFAALKAATPSVGAPGAKPSPPAHPGRTWPRRGLTGARPAQRRDAGRKPRNSKNPRGSFLPWAFSR